ncbi:MAG TPA: hypothetical protein VGK44_03205 [Casimicrobiaceae bacterium]
MSHPRDRRITRTALACGACTASPALAHGFGQRFDLPLPLTLWLGGAGATIVLTFAMIALFVRERSLRGAYPSVDIGRSAIVRVLLDSRFVGGLRVIAVALFALAIGTGLFGAQSAYTNLIVTMVWVVWWVGFAFVCALIGNVWALVNPLEMIFLWAERALASAARARPIAKHDCDSAQVGAWPAVALFWIFAWCELIWRGKDVPSELAAAVIGYAVITWLGMSIFGAARWLASGEAFSMAFGVLARFAPLDVAIRGKKPVIELRPPGAGLMLAKPVRFSYMFFVLLMLATVTFDGFQETPLMQRIDTAAQMSRLTATALFELSEWGFDETQLVHTAALVAFPLLFLAAFWSACTMMVWLRSPGSSTIERPRPTVSEVARTFVLTLVPIAVAYHLSHYFSLLLTAGQFIIPLASDPFGFGWNLFGTAQYKVDLGIVSPYVVWYTAVTLIVIGHVIAVYLAHVDALRIFGDRRAALSSQIPMMLLMIAYTTLSLWIFAQPIVG